MAACTPTCASSGSYTQVPLPTGVVLDGRGMIAKANQIAISMLGEPLEGEKWLTVIQRSFSPRQDDGHEVSLRDGRKVKLSITPLVEEKGQLIVITDWLLSILK